MTEANQVAADEIDNLNDGAQAPEGENQNYEGGESEGGEVGTETQQSFESESEALDPNMLFRELQEIKRQNAEILAERSRYAQPAQSYQQGSEQPSTAKDVVRQALDELAAERQAIEQQQFQIEYERKLAMAPTRFRDFEQAVFKNGQAPFSPAMIEMIKASDDPVATIYHAAKNHSADLERIRSISNQTIQFKEMVKLEEKIKASVKPRVISRAPSPMQHDIGSAGTSAGDDVNSTSGMADFLRRRDNNRST